MNILFLADNFPPERNAQASRVYERACYWVAWGHDVTVITGAPNFPEGKVFEGYKNRWYQTEVVSGIKVVRVKTFIAANKGRRRRTLDYLSYMVAAFIAGLFRARPDLVVATSPQFFAAVGGWALSVAKLVPFVFELSDLWPESIVAVGAMKRSFALRAVEWLELFLYRQSARVVALTGSFKENLVRRGIPPEKIAVAVNGVDLSRFSPRPRNLALAAQWGIAPDEFVVAYIGTLGMAHGLSNVLDAAQLVRNGRIRFLLVGPGAEREMLMAEAARRDISNVTFVPAQPKEAMPDFWSLADLALVHLRDYPLFKTVIPSKIFEAMGMGLPILLVSPQGEASRIVTSEEVGVWIPAGDAQALADAVVNLAASPRMLQDLARASRESAPNHTRERQAKEMLSALQEAAAQPVPEHLWARLAYRGARKALRHANAGLKSMEHGLTHAASPDECWIVIENAAKTLGFANVHMSLCGRQYRYHSTTDTKSFLHIRVSMSAADFIEFSRTIGGPRNQNVVEPFADAVRRAMQPKIPTFQRAPLSLE